MSVQPQQPGNRLPTRRPAAGDGAPSPRARGPVLPRLDATKVERHLPERARIRIEVNGVLAGAPLAVPDAVDELAVGWAFCHHFFATSSQLGRVSSVETHVSLMVEGGVDLDRCPYEAIGWISREHDDDRATGDDAAARPPHAVPVMDELDAIATCRAAFRRFEADGAAVGYAHAALATADDVLCVARDVMAEAAAWKVLGWAIRAGTSCESAMLIVSGIIDEPLVAAACRAGIPIVATDSVPTAAALRAAGTWCVTIFGLVLSHRRGLFADGGHLGDDIAAPEPA